MTGVAALGLWLLTWAPNHQALWAAVESADAIEHRLVPWREITRQTLPLWLVWQPRRTTRSPLGAATYLPAGEWQPAHALLLGRAERLLPRLAVPRLLLDEHHFRAADGTFKRLEQLAPDSAERLLHALVTAHLGRRTLHDRDFADALDARADALMAEVPAEDRPASYAGALTDFAAHILSISHEIGRHQRRRLARGETLCAVIGHPLSLFGGWQKALEEDEYRGVRPAAAPSTRLVQTEAALGRADKDWMLEQLGVDWSGDPQEDFAFLCSPP